MKDKKRVPIDPRPIVTFFFVFIVNLTILKVLEKQEKKEEWQRYLKSLPKTYDTPIPCVPYTTCWEKLAYEVELRDKPTILTFDAKFLWE